MRRPERLMSTPGPASPPGQAAPSNRRHRPGKRKVKMTFPAIDLDFRYKGVSRQRWPQASREMGEIDAPHVLRPAAERQADAFRVFLHKMVAVQKARSVVVAGDGRDPARNLHTRVLDSPAAHDLLECGDVRVQAGKLPGDAPEPLCPSPSLCVPCKL